jgi:hypothetical protein
LFDSQGFSGHAAFMSYFSIISTSKIFIRDLTRKLPLRNPRETCSKC